ncbi:MAG: RNA polymerase factor sigma-54 [Salinivirgaceae bacterium]|nr:RNA polymerase factor sigma-54 [Salinivirgaceae bacterium]
MLKQSLQQKLVQKLTPQQIQVIRLLEVPIMQLDQRIKSEMEENPALEESDFERRSDNEEPLPDDPKDQDELSMDGYLNDDDYIPSYKLYANNYSPDDEVRETPLSQGHTFHESLMSQLGVLKMSDRQRKLAEYIIGSIDDDGYLRRDLESISDDLAFMQNIEASEEELRQALDIVQGFDPAGVGALTLQECLLLQLKRRNQNSEAVQLATKIISKNFTDFSRKHYDKILSHTGVTEQQLKEALEEILKLNPKPGGGYSNPQERTSQPITPDFVLENNDGNLEVILNEHNTPDLRISRTYTNMLEQLAAKAKRTQQDKETINFVKQKIDSAKWFIDAIQQRKITLLSTMRAIVNYQRNYFLDGDEKKLRPMILKDIADITGLDVSTISRVANSKYIQTDFGIYPLKWFFSDSIKTDSGEEVSSREVKSILEEAVRGENKQSPLNDEALADILQKKGYQVARRTVAKYREKMGIPVARMRKEL